MRPRRTDTVLDKIVATKAAHVAQLANRYGDLLTTRARPSQISLFDALKSGPSSFVLECKKASPSKGVIREDFDPVAIASVYSRYAAAISVLTDETFFQGDFAYLQAIREVVDAPLLCKDFIIDVRQLRLARHMGADAALLMLSVLEDEHYLALRHEADALGLDVLTEVSNEEELARALKLDADIIGINNRDLRDLSIDLGTTEQLATHIPDNKVVISESGIYHHSDVRRLAPLADGFLVGSSLTEQPDIDMACRQLIYGHVKVCGLTQTEDARCVAEEGGCYGGLIFAPNSPRCISFERAQVLRQSAPLRFVGVFVDQPIDQVVQIANALTLHAVQLHGNETESYINELRSLLTDAQIWKAVKPDNSNRVTNADHLLFDSSHNGQFGGTGTTFNWGQVSDKHASWLAGGLGVDNIDAATRAGFFGLDINSGVEFAPGIKDPQKIHDCFSKIRTYGRTSITTRANS